MDARGDLLVEHGGIAKHDLVRAMSPVHASSRPRTALPLLTEFNCCARLEVVTVFQGRVDEGRNEPFGVHGAPARLLLPDASSTGTLVGIG